MDGALLVAVGFFVVYYVLDYLSNSILHNDFLSTFPLIMYFFFIYANIDKSMAPFYLLMAFIVLIFSVARSAISQFNIQNSQSMMFGSWKFGGPVYYLINMALGLGTFLFMYSTLNTNDVSRLQAFFGVPLMSIAEISSSLSITTVMALAIIENKFIIVIFEFMRLLKNTIVNAFSSVFTGLAGLLPFMAMIMVPLSAVFSAILTLMGPVLLTAIFFAIMHLAVYNLVFGALLFAFSVMMIWLFIYLITGNDIAMNVGHMLWNALIQYLRMGGVI